MKRMILSLVAAIVAATATYAQSSMLATLSHEGKISTYYGATALREAYNAATNGDIITLSSGSFVAVNIKKALTIRGAGMGLDTTTQTEPTVLTGDFTISIADTLSARLTIEGIYHNHTITIDNNFKNGTFIKSRFNAITCSSSNNVLKNLTMIHCKVTGTLKIPGTATVSCVNCYIHNPYCFSQTTSNFEFVNCVICSTYSRTWSINSSSFKNCILARETSYALDSSNTAYNCVGVYSGLSDGIFYYMPNTTNALVSGYSNVFKSFTGTYNDNVPFELTDTAKEKYKGIDGTQVGMFGGNMPFDATPTNPQITKCNVAAKSTADGKLSVDITVNGAE